jgi:hypothetical protein
VLVGPQAAAAVAQQAGVGQVALQAPVAEEAEGPVVGGLVEGRAVGKVVVVREERQLRQQAGRAGGPAAVGVVGGGQPGAAARAVNGAQDAAPVVVGGDRGVEEALVAFAGGAVRWWSEPEKAKGRKDLQTGTAIGIVAQPFGLFQQSPPPGGKDPPAF